MARSKDPKDPYHHKHLCSGGVGVTDTPDLPVCSKICSQHSLTYPCLQHKKGHWCWTDAELKSLQHQAGVLHLDWSIIAKVSILMSHPTFRMCHQHRGPGGELT